MSENQQLFLKTRGGGGGGVFKGSVFHKYFDLGTGSGMHIQCLIAAGHVTSLFEFTFCLAELCAELM